jgi:MFS family permease
MYYGWNIALALAVSTTVSYGVLFYAFSVVVQPMEAELGWSRAQTSLGFSLAIGMGAITAVPLGRWVDRHGARGLMTLGSVLGSLLVWGWARVQSLPVFYLLLVAMGLAMGAVFYEVAFTVVAVWFRRQRSRAMLLVTLVAGFASTIFVPLTTVLVERLGWRGALEVLAVILALTTVPLHGLVLRRFPGDLGLAPDGEDGAVEPGRAEAHTNLSDATRQPRFWWLTLAFALQSSVTVGVSAHLVPLLAEQGHSSALIAGAAGTIGMMQVLGRLAFGSLRWSLTQMSLLVFGVRITGLLALLVGQDALGLWLFVLLFGASNGMMTLTRAGIVAEQFGSAHYGSISGAMYSAMAVAQAIGPFGAGVLYGLGPGYAGVMVGWLVVALLALIALGLTGLIKSKT